MHFCQMQFYSIAVSAQIDYVKILHLGLTERDKEFSSYSDGVWRHADVK